MSLFGGEFHLKHKLDLSRRGHQGQRETPTQRLPKGGPVCGHRSEAALVGAG